MRYLATRTPSCGLRGAVFRDMGYCPGADHSGLRSHDATTDDTNFPASGHHALPTRDPATPRL